jgi:hypothetical protein
MATLGFPTNPSPGQKYSLGSVTYIFNGTVWSIYQQNANLATVTATQIQVADTSYVNGAQIITTATLNQFITQGITSVFAGTDTVAFLNGSILYIWNTSTFQSVSSRGSSTNQIITITNNTNATSTDSGALSIAGGLGIGKDLWIGGQIFSAGQNVLTTSSFYNQIQSGQDILVTATTQGLLFISDISTLETVTKRGSVTSHPIIITDNTVSTSTNTGALIVRGGVGISGNLNVEGTEFSSGQVVINTTATTVIDTYEFGRYRTAKYLMQIESGLGYGAAFESIELLILVDNIGTVYATEYAIITSNGELGEFSADVTGQDTVNLYFKPNNADTTILKFLRTTIGF